MQSILESSAGYQFDPNPSGVHRQVLDLIDPGSTVLDVGAATGYMASILKSRGCRVVAIEKDPVAAELAKPKLDSVIVADIETLAIDEWNSEFDFILLLDVLEHLRYPFQTLQRLPPLLTERGCLIVSLPNVANWRVRLDLLTGRWTYKRTGILDSTHLRFYTLRTARDLIMKAELKITGEWYAGRLRFLKDAFPTMFAHSFIFKAIPI